MCMSTPASDRYKTSSVGKKLPSSRRKRRLLFWRVAEAIIGETAIFPDQSQGGLQLLAVVGCDGSSKTGGRLRFGLLLAMCSVLNGVKPRIAAHQYQLASLVWFAGDIQ